MTKEPEGSIKGKTDAGGSVRDQEEFMQLRNEEKWQGGSKQRRE